MEAIEELLQLSDSMHPGQAILVDEDADENSTASSRRSSTFLNVVALGNVFQGQAGSDVYMSFVASVISALKMLQVYNNMVLPLKPIDVSVHVASDEKVWI